MSGDTECKNCGDVLGDEFAVFCVYGQWDAEKQGFEDGDYNWHYCNDCWHTDFDATKATHYQTENADELWEILAASDGQLVADLSAFFIPGPCFVRVVDDELQACTVDMKPSPDHPEYDFTNEPRMSEDTDLLLEHCLEQNSDPHHPIYLKTADETPFSGLQDDVEDRRYITEEA